MLTIDTASEQDIADLESRITKADALELAAAGLNVRQSLAGAHAQALRYCGELVCLFGVEGHPSAPRGGVPWMLCTDTLASVPRRAMAQISAQVVARWHDGFDFLTNLIHRRNDKAIKFVTWLGFSVGKTPCGPGQEFFVFEWRRDV